MEKMDQPIGKAASSLPYFVFGAVCGAALGVLLAPESGKESRRKMAQWLKDRREKGRERLEAVETALEAGRKAYKETDKKLSGV